MATCAAFAPVMVSGALAARPKPISYSCSTFAQLPNSTLQYRGNFAADRNGRLWSYSQDAAKESFKPTSVKFSGGAKNIGDENQFSHHFGAVSEYNAYGTNGKVYGLFFVNLLFDNPPRNSGDVIAATATLKKGSEVLQNYSIADATFVGDRKRRIFAWHVYIDDAVVMAKISGDIELSVNVAGKDVGMFKYKVAPRDMRAYVAETSARYAGQPASPLPKDCFQRRS